ncbi:MAG: hypothetical protein RR330_03140 [Alistipes sp.]
MNRTLLERALQTRSEALGYRFCCAAEEYLPQSVSAYPAAWLKPPQLHAIEGRTGGRISFDVTLHLLHNGARLAAVARAQAWETMEEHLINIFTNLSNDPGVIAVEGLTIRPRTYALSNHGEISQTAEARVITFF